LDWAELVTIDLAKFETPEGKRDLADVLVKSVRETGFFYVKNFNIDQELVNRQFALGRDFYELPLEEKQKYIPEGLGSSFSFSKPYLRTSIPCGRRRGFQRLHPCWTLYVRGTISS
jgi:isopenicillin N synthase-like dioxygenase